MNLEKRKADRFSFLLKLYENVDGRTNEVVDGWELGKLLEFDKDYSTTIYYYLNEEGLVEPSGAGIRMTITHAGIKEVERILSKPNEPTEHFLPYNQYNIQIGTMSGGAIQQGTLNSNIAYVASSEAVNELKSFIDSLKSALPTLNLTTEQLQEVEADIQTIEQQGKSPKPKKEILKTVLLSIKTMIEGTAAGVAATIATPVAQELLQQVNTIIQELSK